MLSIVVANWNGGKILPSFLDSLVDSTKKDIKLYIVDNGSKDNSISIIEKYREKLDIELIILDKNYGFASANNIAIEKAIQDDSEYILTLNNDILLESDTLEKVFNYAKSHKEIDVFQLLMINYFNRELLDCTGLKLDKYGFVEQLGYGKPLSYLENYNSNIDGVCAGAAMYTKKSLLSIKEKELDYFCSDFFAYYEDVDLSLRLRKKGYKSRLVKEAKVFHMHSYTGNGNTTFKDYYLSRNLLKYINRNLEENKSIKVNIRLILIYIKWMLKLILTGNFKNIRVIIKGISDYYRFF